MLWLRLVWLGFCGCGYSSVVARLVCTRADCWELFTGCGWVQWIGYTDTQGGIIPWLGGLATLILRVDLSHSTGNDENMSLEASCPAGS